MKVEFNVFHICCFCLFIALDSRETLPKLSAKLQEHLENEQHEQAHSTLMQDKSWRVRYNVAQQLCQLCEALGPDLARQVILNHAFPEKTLLSPEKVFGHAHRLICTILHHSS